MAKNRPLPETMTPEEKEAYRYGWRAGRTVSLDRTEQRYADAAWPIRSAFYDGYDDRSLGYDFGATPHGEGPE
jgi:hypothetical protein